MNEGIAGEPYVVLIGGPDGQPSGIALAGCKVRIRKLVPPAYDTPTAVYTQDADQAASVSDVVPALIYTDAGLYRFAFTADTPASGAHEIWEWSIDHTDGISAHDTVLMRVAAATDPAEPMAGVTFDPALPTLRDHIRLALGDTDVTAGLVADATIDTKLGLFGYSEALAQLAEGLISSFGQRPSKYGESGGVTIEWAGRIDAWKELVKAARSGQVVVPTTTRVARAGMAIAQTTAQTQTTRTARVDANAPTFMEGFRAD